MAATLTIIIGFFVAILSGVGIPLLANRKSRNAEATLANVESWDKMTTRLDNERESLRKQLDESDERHRKQIEDMEADWERRQAASLKQIADLQAEVDALGRQLAQALRRGGGSV